MNSRILGLGHESRRNNDSIQSDQRFGIERSDDWYLPKLQEEVADVIAMTLLFAQGQNMDVEKALREKWFKYLEELDT